MADNELKNFNVVVLGPDMVAGQGPTQSPNYRLPEPGPDSEQFEEKSNAPGYKFGSYLNVYNFDAAISKILGCDEWSLCQKPIIKEVWDCGCLIEEIVGYEDSLLIDHPEENNIPRNVSVLLQDGMLKGGLQPEDPDEDNIHYHYTPTSNEEDKFRGWWVSTELEQVLKEHYGWNFYEKVSIESSFSFPYKVDGDWIGGVEKNLSDIEFHDLDLAIDDNINLPGAPDTRAKGDRADILALFSYAVLEGALNALESASATLIGSCDDELTPLGAGIDWDAVISVNPDAGPESYSILVQKQPNGEKTQVVEVGHDPNEGSYTYNDSFDETYPTGVPSYPRYFIYWTSVDGSKSPEIEMSKSPDGFISYGIPACSGETIELTKIEPEGGWSAQCFKEEYGTVDLTWTIPVPENSIIGEIKIKRTLDGETATYTLESDIRSFRDETAKHNEDLTDNEITYSVEVELISLADEQISQLLVSNELLHTPAECSCEDIEDEACLDRCWVKKDANGADSSELLIWLEEYTEDPFRNNPISGDPDPTATFKIKYCIKEPCYGAELKKGISDFSIRLKLPNKMIIQGVDSNNGEIEITPDFHQGRRDGEWILEPDDDGWDGNSESRGTLCTVSVDRPIGNERISFIIADKVREDLVGCWVEVDSTDTEGNTYNWDNNYQNKLTEESKWQAGPPLSVCTSEIDMGYGDYLLDVAAVDMDTFDVNVCLSRDGFDTFFLVVINTDFKTEIASIDQVVGQAVNAGWEVTHQNILPGMSVITGHGQKPIYSAGYETLLRAELTESSIKFNEDNDTCVCIFPFFFKLGGLYETVKAMTSNYGNSGHSNVTQLSAGNAGFGALATGDLVGAAPAYSVNTQRDANANVLVNGMTNIANNIDPRFKEIVDCLKDAFIRVLEDLEDPEKSRKYSQEDVLKIVLLIQLFLMMITIFSTISISKNDEINQMLDGIEALGESICSNRLEAVLTPTVDTTEIGVDIKYCIPTGDVVGVQFEINVPEGYAIDLSDRLPGDAKSQQFLQCLGTSGKYLCVYDYKLGARASENYSSLSTVRGMDCDDDLPTLTHFKLVWISEDPPPAEMPTIGFVDGTVKLVTNTVRTDPTNEWTGNWYDTDGEINARDLLVSCILCVGGTADLASPDLIVVLPDTINDEIRLIKNEYFGGGDVSLSGISYDPSTWYGRDADGAQEHVLGFLDADGINNGSPDITDVVTVRNLFTKLGQSSCTKAVAKRQGSIVPQEVCTIGNDYDFEFYIPDECSNFCIKPKCSSMVWISDVIVNAGKEGTPKDVLLEISYSTDCKEDEDSEASSRLSGIQFQIGGLGGAGILSSLNGKRGRDQRTGTAVKNYDWKYHVLTSSKERKVKDTFIAYAQAKDGYIPSGKGVLTYLRINPSSISGLSTTAASDKQFVFANGYKLKNHSQDSEVINEFVGVPPSHPMASLYATTQNSSSLLTMQKFGIGIVSHTTTTNDMCEELPEGYDKDKAFADRVAKLISKKLYDKGIDANEDKKLNIIDVQTAFHTKNMDAFFEAGEDEIVPVICCTCEAPGDFKLAVADFNTDLNLPKISGWNRDLRISVDGFKCGENFEGGILLAWTASEKSKYYIVYRKRKGSTSRPIPVIASKNGVIDSSREFHGTKKASSEAINKYPRQLGSSTIWVDFPPSGLNDCCDWCPDDPNCDPKNQAEEYEYYVVAVNECGNTFSNKADGEIECCNFVPKALDDLIVVEGNFDYSSKKTHMGMFEVLTPIDKRTGNVYTFTSDAGTQSKTESGGRVRVGGGSPRNKQGIHGTAGDFSYEYTPPPNFLGRDKIKYYAYQETRGRKDWRDWCYDEGVINVLVYPACPDAVGVSGECGDSDERGGAILSWKPILGVNSYRIYRDGVFVTEVENDVVEYLDIPPNAEELQEQCNDTPIVITYSVTSVYIVEGQEFESNYENEKNQFEVIIDCCAEIPEVDIIINTEGKFCNELGDTRQYEQVEISWIDLGDFDEYRVYRRGPYEEIDTPVGDWILVGSVEGQPDQDGMHQFMDSLSGCEGCGINVYDYYVSVITASGEGEPEQGVKQLSFKCCEVAPVARDQEFTVERGKNLIDKQLLAFDADINIDKYELLYPPSDEAGYVYELDEDAGTFSFQPAYSYYGPAQFVWKVTDTCGNSDKATVTLWIEGEDFCNEDDFVICNASLTYLTDQQDKKNSRKKIEELPQVPFFLNNKGVPSLRKRCGAYSVSQGIDPSLFGLPQEGCGYYTVGTGGGLIIPSISFSCINEIGFGICKPNNGTGIPSIDLEIQCLESVIFSSCSSSGNGSGIGSILMECTDPTLFVEECNESSDSAAGEVEMECGEDQEFSNCSPTEPENEGSE